MKGGSRLPPAEIALVHAWLETRPRTRAGVMRCRAEVGRIRDVVQHGPSIALALEGERLTTAQRDAARPAALSLLRERCRICGQCAAQGVEPP